VYVRQVDEQPLTFAVSGLLWNRSLVMIDSETRSLWSHLLGKAMAGPLKDKQLESIPSTMTDWATWVSRHPETTVTVLSRMTNRYKRIVNQEDPELLIGYTNGMKSRAWPLIYLRKQSLVNDHLDDQPLLISYDHAGGTAVVFDRTVDGRTLTFADDRGDMVDHETGTTWDRVTGKAIAGELAAHALRQLRGIISLNHAWASFYPESTYWTGPQLAAEASVR